MACRTACSPPRNSCSAIGICSGRSAASMALRCTVDVGATGRSPRAGRPSLSPGRCPPGRRGPPRPAWRPVAAALVTATLATGARAAAITPAPVAPLTVVVAVAPPLVRAGGEDHRHVGRPLGRALDLNAALGLLGRAGRLRRGQRQDLDALETDFDVGPQHRADGLAGRHEGGFDRPLGLARASGAPGP